MPRTMSVMRNSEIEATVVAEMENCVTVTVDTGIESVVAELTEALAEIDDTEEFARVWLDEVEVIWLEELEVWLDKVEVT